jgi:hypothetical protein
VIIPPVCATALVTLVHLADRNKDFLGCEDDLMSWKASHLLLFGDHRAVRFGATGPDLRTIDPHQVSAWTAPVKLAIGTAYQHTMGSVMPAVRLPVASVIPVAISVVVTVLVEINRIGWDQVIQVNHRVGRRPFIRADIRLVATLIKRDKDSRRSQNNLSTLYIIIMCL